MLPSVQEEILIKDLRVLSVNWARNPNGTAGSGKAAAHVCTPSSGLLVTILSLLQQASLALAGVRVNTSSGDQSTEQTCTLHIKYFLHTSQQSQDMRNYIQDSLTFTRTDAHPSLQTHIAIRGPLFSSPCAHQHPPPINCSSVTSTPVFSLSSFSLSTRTV